jgi:hypothetical protein
MRREAGKDDYLRALRISLLRISNGLVLEVPEKFVPKVRQAVEVTMRQRTPR